MGGKKVQIVWKGAVPCGPQWECSRPRAPSQTAAASCVWLLHTWPGCGASRGAEQRTPVSPR